MGKHRALGSVAIVFAVFAILPLMSLAQHGEGSAAGAADVPASGSEASSDAPVLLAQAGEEQHGEQPPPEGAAGAPPEGEAGAPPEEQGAPPQGDEGAEGQPAAAPEEQGAPPQGDERAEGQPAAAPEEPAAQPQTAEGAPAEDDGPTLEEIEKQMSPEEFDKLTDTGEAATANPGEVPQPLPTPAPDAAGDQAAPEPTSAPGTTPANIPSEAEMRQGMLDAHAKARAAVGAGPLSWSPALAAHAQEWADRLKQGGCNMEHRSGQSDKGYGENLFWAGGRSSSEGPDEQIDVHPGSVVQGWDDEKADYNAATHTCAAGKACGHYTQVVWKTTTEVGCAMAVCDDKSQVWVCNYNPPGNYSGQKPF